MENVIIEIGANTKEFLQGLSEAGDKTEDLGHRLKTVGVAAGVAFAGFTGSIMGSVYAYREQEKIALETEAILRSTGGVAGVTKANIDEYAESLSKLTTYSVEQVAATEQVLLGFTRIGKNVFPEAAKATLDLAQRMGGDTAGAARVLGRALQDPEEGYRKLSKAGVIFTAQQKEQIKSLQEAGNVAGAQRVIIAQVESQYGGMAQAAAGGTGAVIQLKNVLEDLAQDVGRQFAPYVSQGALALRDLILQVKEHEIIFKVAAGFLAAGAAVSGTVAVTLSAAAAWASLSSVMGGAAVALGVVATAARVAVGASGVGLLLLVAYEVYANWGKLWPAMQGVFEAFAHKVGTASQGLSRALRGAFSFNPDEIRAGLSQMTAAFTDAAKSGAAAVAKVFEASPEAKRTAASSGTELGMIEARNRHLALQREEDAQRRVASQARRAHQEADLLEREGHTSAVVALKKREATILETLADERYKGDKAALRRHLGEVQKEYAQAAANEQKQIDTFNKLSNAKDLQLSNAKKASVISTIATVETYKEQELKEEIERRNKFLIAEQKYGSAYAEINRITQSEVVQSTSKSLSTVEQMTQSSNAELKAIGKAAALWNIGIKTVESAENVYAGFSTIPIIGQALGIAGAAAAIAFGAEQSAKVLAMNKGGLVRGGIRGVDSVPIMGQEGELMAPPQNFEEVVGGVAAQRMGKKVMAKIGSPNGGPPQEVVVVIEMKGDASRYLQVRDVRDSALGVSRRKT